MIPLRTTQQAGSFLVSNDTALKSSAVWASIRLRADSVSTMPLEVKRKNPDGSISKVDTANLQLDGIGGRLSIEEWLYSSQADLDQCGNAFGIIKLRDPVTNRPTMIELVTAENVTVQMQKGELIYRFGGERHSESDVWHERQYTMAGSLIGLSPLRYAAMTVGQNLSALKFGLDYFQTSGLPTVQVKNTKKVLTPEQADIIKRRYEDTMKQRGVFVSGSDWEIDIKSIKADESQFLATLDASGGDIARFFGVAGDLIGLNASGQAVTYANITQRFLEFLVLHLQPALVRRERAFSRYLLPNKVFAKFDTSALLRLDPTSFAAMCASLVGARIISPDEARAMFERAPLTPEQTAQIHDLIAIAALPTPAEPKIPNKPEV
jgi:HK97 family phage portal protein